MNPTQRDELILDTKTTNWPANPRKDYSHIKEFWCNGMGHYADDTHFPTTKDGVNANKEEVTVTNNYSEGGATSATQITGGENDTVASYPVKLAPTWGANTKKMFAQIISHNDSF